MKKASLRRIIRDLKRRNRELRWRFAELDDHCRVLAGELIRVADENAEARRWTLVGGQVLANTHLQAQCAGRPCALHNHSLHHMRDWPQNWRQDRGVMERICPHGVGHPDPDDLTADTVHGCDGCCHGVGPAKVLTTGPLSTSIPGCG